MFPVDAMGLRNLCETYIPGLCRKPLAVPQLSLETLLILPGLDLDRNENRDIGQAKIKKMQHTEERRINAPFSSPTFVAEPRIDSSKLSIQVTSVADSALAPVATS